MRKLYGIQSIPMNFLIDPQGKIVATYLRGEELMKKLEDIL
jgi:cytochrome oxidase Cu insertion factor (SCO1/SenC/PrrC family)